MGLSRVGLAFFVPGVADRTRLGHSAVTVADGGAPFNSGRLRQPGQRGHDPTTNVQAVPRRPVVPGQDVQPVQAIDAVRAVAPRRNAEGIVTDMPTCLVSASASSTQPSAST